MSFYLIKNFIIINTQHQHNVNVYFRATRFYN